MSGSVVIPDAMFALIVVAVIILLWAVGYGCFIMGQEVTEKKWHDSIKKAQRMLLDQRPGGFCGWPNDGKTPSCKQAVGHIGPHRPYGRI